MRSLCSSTILLAVVLVSQTTDAFVPSKLPTFAVGKSLRSTTEDKVDKNQNVLQTEDTSREKIMTFSYDMSLEPKYEKPTYPGTGNGLSGDSGEYDVIVIGSGMGGLTCGAIRYVVEVPLLFHSNIHD